MSPERYYPENVSRHPGAWGADGAEGAGAADGADRSDIAEGAGNPDDADSSDIEEGAGDADGAESSDVADGAGDGDAPIWAETFRVRSYETDPNGSASMISICNYLQEAASNHARALGVSVEQLEESNTTWVLARLRVEVDRYPRWRNEVRVETWPSGTERVFATRDFLVSDEGGLILGRATSAWLLIDRRRRRPVRLPADIVDLNLPDRPRAFDHGDAAIPVAESGGSEEGVDVREIRARYYDMDVNGHVNNVRYIEWAMEPVRKHVLESRQIARLDVQFKGEAVFGDALEVAVGADRDRRSGDDHDSFVRGSIGPDSLVLFHTVRRADDARELTRLRSVWRNAS